MFHSKDTICYQGNRFSPVLILIAFALLYFDALRPFSQSLLEIFSFQGPTGPHGNPGQPGPPGPKVSDMDMGTRSKHDNPPEYFSPVYSWSLHVWLSLQTSGFYLFFPANHQLTKLLAHTKGVMCWSLRLNQTASVISYSGVFHSTNNLSACRSVFEWDHTEPDVTKCVTNESVCHIRAGNTHTWFLV